MKIRGTDFVMLEVADMDRSIAFYRDTLGMEIVERYENIWVEFQAAPTTLALYRPEDADARTERKSGGAVIALSVENVKEAVEELRGKGVPIVRETMDTPVCWMAGITDPDGNGIALHQRKDGTFG